MKRITLAALIGATLLSGCASEGGTTGSQDADRGYALGSYIPRKASTENVKNVDRQAFENDRIMNTGVNNGPGAK
jgi:hypothetical protein